MSEVVLALALTPAALAAPVPAEKPPDPLAWGYLGIRVPQNTLVISSVEPNTPAARAGLMAEDVLTKVGTVVPDSFEQAAEHISSFQPGSLLRIEVRQNGESRAFTVCLGDRPADLPPPPIRNRLPVHQDP